MKLAIADPPYPGQAAKHYGDHPDYAGEVNHMDLIKRLDADYDGWALHTTSTALSQVLIMAAAQGVTDFRIMAWFKPFAAFKRNVSVAYAWEPILVKPARKPVVRHRVVMRDWIEESEPTEEAVRESITMRRGLTGAKPEKVCHWLFEMLGAEAGDTLDDLYPGTGAITAAWQSWREAYA